MHTKWLEDFVALARYKSFTRAADERQVTLPAFGRRIKALESWLGVPLINRGEYPATLTGEGLLFLQTAQDILAKLYEGRACLRARSLAGSDTLSVATGRTLAHTFFPELLEQLRKQVGTFHVRVSTGSVHDMALQLEEDVSDVLLSYYHTGTGLRLDERPFHALVVGQETLIPVCCSGTAGKPLHMLPGTARKPVPLLSYLPTLMMGNVLDMHLLDRGDSYHLQRTLTADFAEALLEHVYRGLGVAWLPRRLIGEDLARGRLVHAGTPADEIMLEIRLYKRPSRNKRLTDTCWQYLSESYGTQLSAPVLSRTEKIA